MKRIIIFLASISIFISCKKDDGTNPITPTSTTVDFTMTAKLDNPLHNNNTLLIDSTEFFLYTLTHGNQDTTFVKKGYTNHSGIVNMSLTKGSYYYIKAISRTYKYTFDSQPHYYKYETSIYYTSYPYITAEFNPSAGIFGYGCTSYYIQDPTE